MNNFPLVIFSMLDFVQDLDPKIVFLFNKIDIRCCESAVFTVEVDDDDLLEVLNFSECLCSCAALFAFLT